MTDWSEIVEKYGHVVWITAYQLLRNDADASDCYQDTFVSVVKIAAKSEVIHWPALLKKLATSRALDILRARHRYSNRSGPWPDVPLSDKRAFEPSTIAEANEIVSKLRNALTQIEPRQAEVFCLVALHGLSYQEVAEQMKLSTNHVGVLLNRAKSNLQVEMQSHKHIGTTKKDSEG